MAIQLSSLRIFWHNGKQLENDSLRNYGACIRHSCHYTIYIVLLSTLGTRVSLMAFSPAIIESLSQVTSPIIHIHMLVSTVSTVSINSCLNLLVIAMPLFCASMQCASRTHGSAHQRSSLLRTGPGPGLLICRLISARMKRLDMSEKDVRPRVRWRCQSMCQGESHTSCEHMCHMKMSRYYMI